MTAKERWLAYPGQVFIAIDQLINSLIPPFLTLSYADETLSARTWRAARRGKIVGSIALPLIDALFFWQASDPDVDAMAGRVVTGHCERAYYKEQLRRGLPPEYREIPNSKA